MNFRRYTKGTGVSRPSCTPLTCAVEFGHVDCAKVPSGKGSCCELVKSRRRHTTDYCLRRIGHAELIKTLLDAEADVNSINNYCCEALWDATLNGHPECAKILIEAGGDVKGSDGVEPIMAAAFNGDS